MKLSNLRLDFAGVLSVFSLAGGLGALAFSQLGKQEAADAINNCVSTVNAFGSNTLPACKEAGKEVASATKELAASVLFALSTVTGIFSKSRK